MSFESAETMLDKAIDPLAGAGTLDRDDNTHPPMLHNIACSPDFVVPAHLGEMAGPLGALVLAQRVLAAV